MTRVREQQDETLRTATDLLLRRATDSYSVTESVLFVRVRAVVEKYLLRDNPSAASADISDFVEKLQADDLCLIVACEEGNEQAWSDLVQRFGMTVRSAARSVSSNEDGAEELTQSIWAELHGLRVGKDGKTASKLAYYSGRGSLAGWLRAVVGQLAVDQHRKQSRLVQTEEDSDFDRMLVKDDHHQGSRAEIPNPEIQVSDKSATADLQAALSLSISHLSDEDRLLVKLYYFDGLKLREAGAVLGVHEATASRRLARIQSELREHVEESLKKQHQWTSSEIEHAFSTVALNLQTDIEPMLVRDGLMKPERELTG